MGLPKGLWVTIKDVVLKKRTCLVCRNILRLQHYRPGGRLHWWRLRPQRPHGRQPRRRPLVRTEPAQSALHFTPCSFQRHPDLSGKHSSTLQLLRDDCSFTYPPVSVTRYSIIRFSELWQRGVNEIAKGSKRQQEDSNLGSLG